MSEMGQSQPNWAARAMSGLPPIATVLRTSQVVRFVPDSEVANPIRQLYIIEFKWCWVTVRDTKSVYTKGPMSQLGQNAKYSD